MMLKEPCSLYIIYIYSYASSDVPQMDTCTCCVYCVGEGAISLQNPTVQQRHVPPPTSPVSGQYFSTDASLSKTAKEFALAVYLSRPCRVGLSIHSGLTSTVLTPSDSVWLLQVFHFWLWKNATQFT